MGFLAFIGNAIGQRKLLLITKPLRKQPKITLFPRNPVNSEIIKKKGLWRAMHSCVLKRYLEVKCLMPCLPLPESNKYTLNWERKKFWMSYNKQLTRPKAFHKIGITLPPQLRIQRQNNSVFLHCRIISASQRKSKRGKCLEELEDFTLTIHYCSQTV